MKYIVGIDEVGRGPLAGPVTVGIVACEQSLYKKLKKNRRLPPLGKDSKKLSEKNREVYSKYLKYISVTYAVIHVSNKIIDAKGLSFAIKFAIDKGIKKLKLNPKNCEVKLDGGLRAPLEFKNQKTIIKGDEKVKIIAWASILAKVSRDNLMKKISKKYPEYNLHAHKGYGTLFHRTAIKQYGLSPLHRRTFCTRL